VKQVEVRLCFGPEEIWPVGRLAEVGQRRYVEYDASFLVRGLPLSPFRLPLQAGAIEHRDRDFGPLPGVFEDSLPDGWGRLLMDRHFRQQGREPAAVSVLDRLLWLGTRTLGALTYHPAVPGDPAAALDLPSLLHQATAIHAGAAAVVLPQLLRAGGSPGGARPKLLVGLRDSDAGEGSVADVDTVYSGEDELPAGYAHWLVKFAAKQELIDAGPLEQAYALMARAAGVELPPTRLIAIGPRYRCFAVQRFDRLQGQRRLHMHSLAGLLHADFRVCGLDYADLFRVTLALTRDHQQLLRAFRQMLFNIAAHNRDDHGKNFAFLMDADGVWRLSPAFDLVWSHGPGGEHSTSVAGIGRDPGIEQVRTLARQFDVRPAELELLRAAVNDAVARWRVYAEEAGCSRRIRTAVATSLRAV
jgi:serine/threonine-protein kinase HipA